MNKTSGVLAHRVIGKGRPVVFLHGFLESSSMWNYLTMPNEIQAVLIDLPRHGKSKEKEGKSIGSIAQQVLEVVAFLNIRSFSVIGHSLGGYVALELKKQSSKCEKVVLLNSHFWEDSPAKKQDRERVVEVVSRLKNQFIEQALPNLFCHPKSYQAIIGKMIQEAKEISAEGIAELSLAMKNRKDNQQMIAENPKDFWVIQGELDSVVAVEKMRLCHKKNAFNYVEIPSVGHMAHIENSLAVEKVLRKIICFSDYSK